MKSFQYPFQLGFPALCQAQVWAEKKARLPWRSQCHLVWAVSQEVNAFPPASQWAAHVPSREPGWPVSAGGGRAHQQAGWEEHQIQPGARQGEEGWGTVLSRLDHCPSQLQCSQPTTLPWAWPGEGDPRWQTGNGSFKKKILCFWSKATVYGFRGLPEHSD